MTKTKDPAEQVPYQQAARVRQLLAERENAVTYGQDTRVAAVDKQLAELGVTVTVADEPAVEKSAPKGRKTASQQTAAQQDTQRDSA